MQPILSLGASTLGAADLVRLRHLVTLATLRLPFQLEWREGPQAESADVMFIDVDSIYGHVDWLRAQAGGRALIALTKRPNGMHDNEFDLDSNEAALSALLLQFESMARPGIAAGATPGDVVTARSAAAQADTREMPSLRDAASGAKLAATREMPTLPAQAAGSPEPAPAAAVAEPEPPAPPPPPRDAMSLLDWLREADGVEGVSALRLDDGSELIVDRTNSLYYGPAALKPLLPLAQETIARGQWTSLDASAVGARAGGNASQPLARLRLIAGLGGNHGALRNDLDPSLPFQLPKWPQIEREFPKHMRIATALMKGPVTIDDLVAQLGLPYAEVADFLNGFVAAGFVEQVHPVVEPEPAPPAAGEKFMGRLRAFGRKP